MDYKQAVCPKCSGDLPPFNGKKTVTCEFCGTTVVRENVDGIDYITEILSPTDDPLTDNPERTKDLTSNFTDAFEYTKHALWGRWMRWIVLIVCSLITPFIFGFTLHVMKGVSPAPEPDNFVKMLTDGLKACVIYIVYLFIPIIIGAFLLTSMGIFFDLGLLLLSILLIFILAILSLLLANIGVIRFARTGSMSSAFAIHRILFTIKKIGFSYYSIITIFIYGFSLIIMSILMAIPVIGWLAFLFGLPFIFIFTARVMTNLYDSTQ